MRINNHLMWAIQYYLSLTFVWIPQDGDFGFWAWFIIGFTTFVYFKGSSCFRGCWVWVVAEVWSNPPFISDASVFRRWPRTDKPLESKSTSPEAIMNPSSMPASGVMFWGLDFRTFWGCGRTADVGGSGKFEMRRGTLRIWWLKPLQRKHVCWNWHFLGTQPVFVQLKPI